MDTIYRRCSGLDVHKDSVQACVRVVDESGKVAQEGRGFSTMTDGIRELGAWLKAEAVTHVAMESTGVYWKPIWNLLEGGLPTPCWSTPGTSRTSPAARPTCATAGGWPNCSSAGCCAAVS